MRKVKARDIVQGWPRGKSTMVPYPARDYSFWPERFMRPLEIPSSFSGLTIDQFAKRVREQRKVELQRAIDLLQFECEAELTEEYHRKQAEMVEKYRREVFEAL